MIEHGVPTPPASKGCYGPGMRGSAMWDHILLHWKVGDSVLVETQYQAISLQTTAKLRNAKASYRHTPVGYRVWYTSKLDKKKQCGAYTEKKKIKHRRIL